MLRFPLQDKSKIWQHIAKKNYYCFMIKPAKSKHQPPKAKPKLPALKKEGLLQILKPLLYILPLVFIAFYPILNNQLTNWDDQSLIIENPLIRKLSWENIKTIFTTFYFGNYQLCRSKQLHHIFPRGHSIYGLQDVPSVFNGIWFSFSCSCSC